MTGIRFYLFLAALCSCSVLGFGEVSPPKTEYVNVDPLPEKTTTEEPATTHPTTTSSTTISSTSSTTPSTTTSSSTTPPTTTSSSTTPSTTTTTTPSTTTPTTTSSTTTTTAPPPTPKPTPPPAPKPVPAPEQGTWMYTDSTNKTCILVQFAAQITLTYSQSVMNKTTIANVTMNVPANATVVDGNCNASTTDQWLQIGWMPEGSSNVTNTILMLFHRNKTTGSYALDTFNLTVDASQLVNTSFQADTVVLSHRTQEWSTSLDTSYRCLPVSELKMSNDKYGVSASIAISLLQEEAFRTIHGKGFKVAHECSGGSVPDAVPIAVGCALGGLVLVVLVAYLVARRRSAARGYLSM